MSGTGHVKASLLSVDDEEDTTAHVVGKLSDFGHIVTAVRDRGTAVGAVEKVELQGILLDQRFSDHRTLDGRAGLNFIRDLKSGRFGALNQSVNFVVLTSFPHEVSVEEYLEIPGFCPPILSKLSVDAAEVCQALGLQVPEGDDGHEFWMDDLLEVHGVANEKGEYFFMVPSWPAGEGVHVAGAVLPEDIRVELEWADFPVYVWARVNVEAEDPEGVAPQDFRLSVEAASEIGVFLAGDDQP